MRRKQCAAFLIVGILALCIVLLMLPGRFSPSAPSEDPTPTATRPSTVGWQILDGKRYYFDEHGDPVTGWLTLETWTYYFTRSGAVTGPQVINGVSLLFSDQGVLGNGLLEYNGQVFLSDDWGRPQSGWFEGRYFTEDGSMATGWVTIGQFRHYFLENGYPATGETNVDGQIFYFASNGQQIPFVNPWHSIDPDYTVELVSINANHQIAAIALDDYNAMMDGCRAAGLDPAICSSYRDQAYQQMLFDRKVSYYLGKGLSEDQAEVQAARSVAYPGTSEHQLGLALDIIDNSNWNLNASQAKTATQKWLMAHSWEYGWILRYPDGKSDITGIIFEPWHYRYVGREVAAELHDSGLCLEEYLEKLSEGVG